MIEIQAPQDFDVHPEKRSVFLAGSIDKGTAKHWQDTVLAGLKDQDIVVLNPRRDDWDESWVESIHNVVFREQVEWEMAALEYADMILFYFSPASQSPITLEELGFHTAANPEKIVVCCPEGFWRKGNVDILCAGYGVAQVDTVQGLIAAACS